MIFSVFWYYRIISCTVLAVETVCYNLSPNLTYSCVQNYNQNRCMKLSYALKHITTNISSFIIGRFYLLLKKF